MNYPVKAIPIMTPENARTFISRTLKKFEACINYSEAAVSLLLGTAIQESRLKHRVQLGDGPALGLWQMEPDTHMDIWVNYLAYRKGELTSGLLDLARYAGDHVWPKNGHIDTLCKELKDNDEYACIMARIKYLRVKDKLPEEGDLIGMARYWKKHYNTFIGKGREIEFINNWNIYHREVKSHDVA